MIELHGVFGSPFVRAIRIALDEKGLRWAWKPFPLGAHKQEPYLTLHPFGKIPAITDDGFPLYETQAILRHIDRKAAAPALIPEDAHAASRMDQLLAIVDCYLWPLACRPINFNRLIAPRIGRPVDEEAVAAGIPEAGTALHAVSPLLADNVFMAGDAISLADCAILPHLDALSMTPEGAPILARHENLTAWLARMRGRPSVAASARAPEKVLAPA